MNLFRIWSLVTLLWINKWKILKMWFTVTFTMSILTWGCKSAIRVWRTAIQTLLWCPDYSSCCLVPLPHLPISKAQFPAFLLCWLWDRNILLRNQHQFLWHVVKNTDCYTWFQSYILLPCSGKISLWYYIYANYTRMHNLITPNSVYPQMNLWCPLFYILLYL